MQPRKLTIEIINYHFLPGKIHQSLFVSWGLVKLKKCASHKIHVILKPRIKISRYVVLDILVYL